MPKIETHYEIDERELYNRNETEFKRIEQLIREKLCRELVDQLILGGFVYFPPPKESIHRREYTRAQKYTAVFEFIERKPILDDLYYKKAKNTLLGVTMPQMGTMTGRWTTNQDPTPKPPPEPPPPPKPACKCMAYSFCQFLCK